MPIPTISKDDLGIIGAAPRPYMVPGEQETLLALLDSVKPAPEVMAEIGVNLGLTAHAVLHRVKSISRYIGIDVQPSYKFELKFQQGDRPAEPGWLVKGDPRFRLILRGKGELPQSADVVFIDGDHGPRNVLQDSIWASSVVRSGGIIIWHDYGNTPAEVTGVLDRLHAEGRDLTHVAGTSLVFERVVK
jgi:predicted O-methyltransferase YrrM